MFLKLELGISANSFLPLTVSAATIQFMKYKIAIMRKLYENFHISHFQKRIVSAKTNCRNTVFIFNNFQFVSTHQ